MANQRLSKLQKWILITCYEVTVLRQREDWSVVSCGRYNEKICRDSFYESPENEWVNLCKLSSGHFCFFYQFTQDDIYSGYYHLPKSDRRSYTDTKCYFLTTEDSNKAYSTTFRSLRNLARKGFIRAVQFEGRTTIKLTSQGEELVKDLMVSEIKSNP